MFFFDLGISYEKCSESFSRFFRPLFCGSEKIPKNSCQISHKNSLQKLKKIHRRASAGAQGEKVDMLKVARLQNEVGTKYFFELQVFLRNMLRNCPRNIRTLIWWAPPQKKGKIPTNVSKHEKCPCTISKNNLLTTFCRSAGRRYSGTNLYMHFLIRRNIFRNAHMQLQLQSGTF